MKPTKGEILSGCVVRAEIQREKAGESVEERRARLNELPVSARPSYLRPYKLPEGGVTMIRLPECCCEDRRGPTEGVCGNCGGAIP